MRAHTCTRTGNEVPAHVAQAVARGALLLAAQERGSYHASGDASEMHEAWALGLKEYAKWVGRCPAVHSIIVGLVLQIGVRGSGAVGQSGSGAREQLAEQGGGGGSSCPNAQVRFMLWPDRGPLQSHGCGMVYMLLEDFLLPLCSPMKCTVRAATAPENSACMLLQPQGDAAHGPLPHAPVLAELDNNATGQLLLDDPSWSLLLAQCLPPGEEPWRPQGGGQDSSWETEVAGCAFQGLAVLAASEEPWRPQERRKKNSGESNIVFMTYVLPPVSSRRGSLQEGAGDTQGAKRSKDCLGRERKLKVLRPQD